MIRRIADNAVVDQVDVYPDEEMLLRIIELYGEVWVQKKYYGS